MSIPSHRQIKAKGIQGAKLKAPKFEPDLRNQKIIKNADPSFATSAIKTRTKDQGQIGYYPRQDSVFISDIDIIQGEYKKVTHNLGRVPVGWTLVDTQIATVSLFTVVRPIVRATVDGNIDGSEPNIYEWTDKYLYLAIVGVTADPGKLISTASWSGGSASVTTTTAHGYYPGNIVTIVLTTPSTWDGTFEITSTPSTTVFTYDTPNDPGTYISGGGTLLNVVTRVGIEIW